MEDVAGTDEKLAKDKAAQAPPPPPPPPFRQRAMQSIYSRIYSEDGREVRNKRAEQRRMRATGIEKLGEEEYKKLLQEIDRMTQTPVNMQELIDKRMKEISERLEAEEKQTEAEQRRQTRSQDRPGTFKDTESEPARRSSPRKRKPDADMEKDGSKKETKKTDPQPKVRQSERVEIDDASKSRKDKAEKQPKQSKKAAIPMIVDDDDDDLQILDKADKDYEPEQEEDDDNGYPIDDDDDNDFQELPPRSRKSTKPSKKPMTTRRVEESTKSKGDAEDETLALFQKIVGPDFEVCASEEYEEDPKDKCRNPVEAAGFRAMMKMMALELKKAVRKGENIEETYTDMIRSTIEVAKAMKYPGATTVELKDIVPAIKDLKCNAWRKCTVLLSLLAGLDRWRVQRSFSTFAGASQV